MLDISITVKNYRAFPDASPVRLRFGKGFTAFVGPNNSGKSSLLRFFYEFRNFFRVVGGVDRAELAAAVRGDARPVQFPSVPDPEGIFCNLNSRDLTVRFDFSSAAGPEGGLPVPDSLTFTFRRPNSWVAEVQVAGRRYPEKPSVERVEINEGRLKFGNGWVADLNPMIGVSSLLADTLYVGPFRNVINVGANADYFDIQVGQAFVERWRQFKSGPTIRLNQAALEVEEAIRRIFEYASIQINPAADNQTLQVVVDGRSYRLAELGSGLAQFILVLANAATRRPAFILIDEPELNLHASLQLDFLTSLATFAKEGVLFSTHSIGLARAGAERIYSFRRDVDGTRRVNLLERTARLAEFAGELNFAGYRELGFDRLLLVEGPSEVKTVQQFLRKYQKDHRVVPLPLGGSSMINGEREQELAEVMRISDKISALIDSERTAPREPLQDSRAAFVTTCGRLGIRCQVLERRALENYFPDRAVKGVMGANYRALAPYEKLGESDLGWDKADNWRIAQEMTREELDATELGPFFGAL